MTDLSDDARMLLARAKHERHASPAALARVRSKVLRRVGLPLAVGAAGTALAAKTAAAPAAPAAVWLLAAKAVGGLVLAGAIAAGSVALEQRNDSPPAGTPARATARATASPTATAATTAAAVVTPATPTVEVPEAPAAPVPAQSITTPATTAAPRTAAATTTTTTPASPISASPISASPISASPTEAAWAADVALLRDAQSSMVAGDPYRARTLAERVTRGGAFDGERGALIAIADCKTAQDDAGRTIARERAATFVNAHDGSSLAARVRAACNDGGASIP